MLRTTIVIDRTRFYLAQGVDPAGLKHAMVDAVQAGGAFVDFTEVGNRSVSALVSPGVSVIFEEHLVEEDERDTGNLAQPYDAPAGAQRGYVDFDIDYLD